MWFFLAPQVPKKKFDLFFDPFIGDPQGDFLFQQRKSVWLGVEQLVVQAGVEVFKPETCTVT